jgi:hypothetical protein
MLSRVKGYMMPRTGPVPKACRQLEDEGYTLLRKVLSEEEVDDLAQEINGVYDKLPPDGRVLPGPLEEDRAYRHEMFNRSALCQEIVAHPKILKTIEPLLGEDCHVISNTSFCNPPGSDPEHKGGAWHTDSGPHIPLTDDQVWPVDIPHPVFAIGAHIFLKDCSIECGPTGVIPGSHLSGKPPPRNHDMSLTWNSVSAKPLPAKAGDVAMFVSDIWHRRLPTSDKDRGRFFLQVHYARRDIAQRLRRTAEVNHLSPQAIARIKSDREKTLLGLHPPHFYDG